MAIDATHWHYEAFRFPDASAYVCQCGLVSFSLEDFGRKGRVFLQVSDGQCQELRIPDAGPHRVECPGCQAVLTFRDGALTWEGR